MTKPKPKRKTVQKRAEAAPRPAPEPWRLMDVIIYQLSAYASQPGSHGLACSMRERYGPYLTPELKEFFWQLSRPGREGLDP